MKKALIFVGAALALIACSKTETVVNEEVGEIAVNAVVSNQTRGAEFYNEDNVLPTDNSYEIYVGANSSQNASFLDNVLFAYRDSKWGASTKSGSTYTAASVYWPVGGQKVDFLAYAKPADSDLAPVFDGTKKADKFTVSSWNTFNKQVDLLYAIANNKKNQAAPVDMLFNHTQALIIFNVRYNTGNGTFKVKEVKFANKYTTGTLEVNNERNNVVVDWKTSGTAADLVMPDGTTDGDASKVQGSNATTKIVAYNTAIAQGTAFKQLGETLLVIPQPASNPIITYTIAPGENPVEYTIELNAKRLDWEAGYAYIYDLSFNNNEITLNPTVVPWTVVDPS